MPLSSRDVPLFVGHMGVGQPHVAPVKVVYTQDAPFSAQLVITDPEVEALIRKDGARVKQLQQAEGMGC